MPVAIEVQSEIEGNSTTDSHKKDNNKVEGVQLIICQIYLTEFFRAR